MGAPKTIEGRQARERILDYCQEYRREHGYYPTRQAICDGLDMGTGTFSHHVRSLQTQGFLDFQPGRFAHTLRLTRRQRKYLQ